MDSELEMYQQCLSPTYIAGERTFDSSFREIKIFRIDQPSTQQCAKRVDKNSLKPMVYPRTGACGVQPLLTEHVGEALV